MRDRAERRVSELILPLIALLLLLLLLLLAACTPAAVLGCT